MCGFFGVYGRSRGSYSEDKLVTALGTLKHRGPDKTHIWSNENLFLGHHRLIVEGGPESGKQPIVDGDRALAYNGEIYDFDVHTSTTSYSEKKSDSDKLFDLLSKYDVGDVLPKITGMFAFAYADIKKGQLLLVRDRLGEKPLFYSIQRGNIIFASEPKAILDLVPHSKKLDINSLRETLLFGRQYAGRSMYSDIKELRPGSLLTFDLHSGQYVLQQYWSPSSLNYLKFKCRQDFLNNFSETFSRVVGQVCSSDSRLGFYASGGMDSNSLLSEYSILQRESNSRSNFEIFFSDGYDPEYSEKKLLLENIKFIKAKSNINHSVSVSILNQETYLKNFRTLSYYFDEPIMFHLSCQLNSLAELARLQGIKVLVAGEGADEILYGYERFFRSREIAKKIENTELVDLLALGGGKCDAPLIMKMLKTDEDDFDFYRESDVWKMAESLIVEHGFDKAQLLFSQQFRLLGLTRRIDATTSAAGIESRCPFLDRRLVELCNSVDPQWLYDNDEKKSKVPLRTAMADKVCSSILIGKKMGSTSDVIQWLRSDQLFLDVIGAQILKSEPLIDLLDMNYVKKILSDHRVQNADYSALIFKLFSLAEWLKH